MTDAGLLAAQNAVNDANARFLEDATDANWEALEKARARARREEDMEAARLAKAERVAAEERARLRVAHEAELERLKAELEPPTTTADLAEIVEDCARFVARKKAAKARADRNSERSRRIYELSQMLGAEPAFDVRLHLASIDAMRGGDHRNFVAAAIEAAGGWAGYTSELVGLNPEKCSYVGIDFIATDHAKALVASVRPVGLMARLGGLVSSKKGGAHG